MKKIFPLALFSILMVSCVSKKDYLALENKNKENEKKLNDVTIKKEQLEKKFQKIEERVADYNQNIESLKSLNSDLKKDSEEKLSFVKNENILLSNTMKSKLAEKFKNIDPALVSSAKTLKDSINLVIAHNLKNKLNNSQLNNFEDINIDIDKTVVMITVADNLLFSSGSYKVKSKANNILEQFSGIIKSEPSIDIMIEGHTDSQSVKRSSNLYDNWDLSVKRATSIVRILESKYGIEANRLIAAGRGSSLPLYDNSNSANRAKNRRTKIIILPNLDKFYSMLIE